MVEEFGATDSGWIHVGRYIGFTKAMEYLCGKEFTVKKVDNTSRNARYYSEEGIDNGWTIIEGMLEYDSNYYCPELPDVDVDIFENILIGA